MTDLSAKRQALDRLDARLADGEITADEYERSRNLLTSGLTLKQCAELGVTPTPAPRSIGGGGVGPSGGATRMPTLAELNIEPGTVLLDQWRIVRELGRGGFGAVFEAEDIKLGRTLAVKVLDPAMAAKEELLARFRREVTLTRELTHERIVRVYDYREEAAEHLALITMEYVRGCSVAAVLALARGSKKQVPVALALAVFEQTLEALAAAHAQGVIHRDVTPGNILLAGGTAAELMSDPERDPRVKLVDFGIAGLVERTELSAKSRVLGTAAYVAPEVLDPDAEITPEADVFGAGAVVYEMLTGKTPMVTGYRQVTDLREDVMPGVGGTITSAVQPVPRDRPSSKGALEALAGRKAEMDRARAHDLKLEELREHLSRALVKGDETSVQGAAAALRKALGEKWKGDSELLRSDAWLQETRKKREEAARQIKAAEEKRRREREAAERRQREDERKRKEHEAAERVKRENEAARRAAEATAAADEKQKREPQQPRIDAARRSLGETSGEAPRILKEVPTRTAPKKKPALVSPWIPLLVVLVLAAAGIWKMASEGWLFSAPTRSEATRERALPTIIPPDPNNEDLTSQAEPSEARAGVAWTDPAVGMRFRYIPAGSFEMGSPSSEAGRSTDERQQRVTITRGYWMGETEVTQGEWRAVMGTNPSNFSSCGDSCPVEQVSWLDAVEFANRLSRKAGLAECYRISGETVSFVGLSCKGYRLPTEAEWEYAARAGTTTPFWTGGNLTTEQANYNGNYPYAGNRKGVYRQKTVGVKSFPANAWGLYEVHGNVYEWVWDWYGEHPPGSVTDPTGPSGGSNRVERGGSWSFNAGDCRSAFRLRVRPGNRYDDLGLRLVRTAG